MKLQYLKNVVTLELDPTRCNGCRVCTQVCPHGVFSVHRGRAQIVNRDWCIECGACMLNCDQQAIVVEKGVGCATAVIYGLINGSEPNCDCGCVESGCDH